MKNLLFFGFALLFCAFAFFYPQSIAAQNSVDSPQEIQKRLTFARLLENARQSGSVKVIVGLNLDIKPIGELRPSEVEGQKADIKRTQTNFLSRYQNLRGHESVKFFDFIPFLAFEVDAATLERMSFDKQIKSIEEDIAEPPMMLESQNVVGAPLAWNAGFNGSGWAVAVLDTGVMKTHSFLTGKVVSEACYSQTVAGTAETVCPGGVFESTAVGSGVNCDPAVTGCAHGTHVAGTVAGSGTTFSGVAKGGNIIAIQVFSRFNLAANCGSNPAPCALSYVSDQIRGLERVLVLSGSMNIAAVNMSLGGGQNTENCDIAQAARKAAIDNLRSVNIATVISSGNNGYTNAMGAPACISTAVSVGSTGDGSNGATLDAVSSFSNSASFLNLLAPGQWIASSVPVTSGSTTTYQNYSGTSMAAPHVAGAWAILKQRRPNASVSTILNALTATGLPITDGRNGIIKPRIRVFNALQAISVKSSFDYDGDAKTDLSIYRGSLGQWWLLRSSDNSNAALTFGNSADKIAPADYTGDGKTDIAIFRPSSGEWFILRSEDNSFYSAPFGIGTDTPVPADFDGDNKADVAVFRPSNATWYINKSSGGTTIQQFGINGDLPVNNDYDGDGKADIAIFRPALGQWWLQRSSNNTTSVYQFGNNADRLVPADYTGDGKADIAFFRPSTNEWYVLRSEDLSFYAAPFGASGDLPIPGDYDGDGKADFAVFRPINNTWYLQRSTAGFIQQVFGTSGDLPTPNAFVR